MDLDEILYGGDDTEDDLDSMMFIPKASMFSKWSTFKLVRRLDIFNRFVDLDEILYGVRPPDMEGSCEYIE
jgi:hypothetical protein